MRAKDSKAYRKLFIAGCLRDMRPWSLKSICLLGQLGEALVSLPSSALCLQLSRSTTGSPSGFLSGTDECFCAPLTACGHGDV